MAAFNGGVTDTNDEEGFAKAVERFILGGR